MITSRDETAFKNDLPDLLELAIEYLKDKANPDDVFSDSQLEEWAENNGYIKDPEA